LSRGGRSLLRYSPSEAGVLRQHHGYMGAPHHIAPFDAPLLSDSPKQFLPTASKRGPKSRHDLETRITGSRLDPLDVPPINIGSFRQSLLCQLHLLPKAADISAQNNTG
jgi:hypothetical protein